MSKPARRGAILILGPTAVGKSSLAMGLAEHFELEIVNADALQVYRGLDIGTAKPDAEDRQRVPHHLIDILDPSEPFSAGEFKRRAEPVLEAIHSRGHVPVVVGGSGFYLRTLTRGLSPIPEVPDAVRRQVTELCDEEGFEAVRRRLKELDPETAQRVKAEDTQRTLRALEVVLGTGRGLAEWWRREPPEAGPSVALKLGLTLSRALLYDRIARRVDEMVAAGWVEEVSRLLEGGGRPEWPAFQAIGYRQVVRHIRGEWSLEEALEDAARETRRFAKRQLTWFRKETDVVWIDGEPGPAAIPIAVRAVEASLGDAG